MPTKRQKRFREAVARAARAKKPIRKPCGRPTPENLTEEGRRKGLEAIARAPRCEAIRKNGMRCKALALKGATRCIKHGGRVEVPDHPHNIRRFLTGQMDRAVRRQDDYVKGKSILDSLTLAQIREITSAIPDDIQVSDLVLTEAALLWMDDYVESVAARRRAWFDFCKRHKERAYKMHRDMDSGW